MRRVHRLALAAGHAALALCGAVVLVPAHAEAQRQDRHSLSERQINRLAAEHFRLGSDAFRAERYADAAREFETVYQLTPQPEMLFNLARAYEAAGNVSSALQTWQLFLDRGAPSIGAEQVRGFIAALRARQAGGGGQASGGTDAAANAGATSTCQPASGANGGGTGHASATPLLQLRVMRVEYRRSTLNEAGPWVVGAAGLVVGGFAAWTWSLAQDSISLYQQANRGDITWTPPVQRAYDSAPGQLVAASVLTGVGGALLLTSIGWLIFRGRGERREVVEAAASPIPGGGFALALGGRL